MSAEGIGASVRALRYWERRQEVVANNLANVSTPGFKGERVFARLLDGGPEAASATDPTRGALSRTGRPLDLALEGDGFLVVRTDLGERYLRGGSFTVDAGGTVVTSEGHPLLGENGPLTLPPGEIVVERDGTLLVDGAVIGRLRVEEASAPPLREGANLWEPQGAGLAVAPGDVRMRSGHLEESNVDPVRALVEMIEVQRAYGAVHRSVLAADDVMQTITSEIGRVGG
ncbi:MAG TPA: flagellar hook-basal body protein [Longimicrobiales bacterium]|nr:flagellar hook-basal body protein [Longimicrobiales bacterium]